MLKRILVSGGVVLVLVAGAAMAGKSAGSGKAPHKAAAGCSKMAGKACDHGTSAKGPAGCSMAAENGCNHTKGASHATGCPMASGKAGKGAKAAGGCGVVSGQDDGCPMMAGQGHGKHGRSAAKRTKVAVLCPVMGKKVASTATAPKSVYNGKTYYFCCPGCKPQFDKNPKKYVR